MHSSKIFLYFKWDAYFHDRIRALFLQAGHSNKYCRFVMWWLFFDGAYFFRD